MGFSGWRRRERSFVRAALTTMRCSQVPSAATPVHCDACHAAVMQQVDLASERADPMGVDRAYEDSCRNACGLCSITTRPGAAAPGP